MKPTSKSDPETKTRRDADFARPASPCAAGVDASRKASRGRNRLNERPARPSLKVAANRPDESGANEPDDLAFEIRVRQERRRRARGRVRARALMVLIPSILISGFLLAATHVVMGDWRHWQGEVRARETQLAALDTQLELGRRRLTTLQAPKGREQLLIEHGFIAPGERILLFPPTPSQKRAIANDLSPQPIPSQPQTGSALRRATRSIGDWWRSLRGISTDSVSN